MGRSSSRAWRQTAVTGLVLVLLPDAALAQALIALEDLPGGFVSNRVFAISPDGTTAVGQSHSDLASIAEAYRRLPAGIQGLGRFPDGFSGSRAYSVSNGGNVVVGYASSAEGEKAFLWTPLAGMRDIGAGGFGSAATAVSSSGQVVYGRRRAASPGYEMFRWTEAAGLAVIGRNSSEINVFATDTSGDGLRMVGWSDTKAFLWNLGAGYTNLGDLPGGLVSASAYSISEDGTTIVGSSDDARGPRAVRWTQATGWVGVDLGPLPGDRDDRVGWSYAASAAAVNGDGSIVVGNISGSDAMQTEFESFPFIWDEVNGMRELEQVLTADYGLDTSGFDIARVVDISADGNRIVGQDLLGEQSWMAVLVGSASVPGPSGYGMLLGALLVALSGRGPLRRRRPR
jgi:probable HAF family extracellular repeat protein